ncbi:hypothetical protein [Falsarthrobacter nasiphocae]|uniref:MFS family permease n=1 Tax=Falsarthrobacter nasiphocae TaxID=189863 RepID=A0AAE3YD70_9MICC|nr:hypothetical protein [Falsarthrobacter nasiphocae]MDR6891708.1 MFS family permease [Falsarthrobacter nasiphocae]
MSAPATPVPLDARWLILTGFIESFAKYFFQMAIYMWLTLIYLPATGLVPAGTSTLVLAASGLVAFVAAGRLGHLVDSVKPYGLGLWAQIHNIPLVLVAWIVIMASGSMPPWAVVAIILGVNILLEVRELTIDSAQAVAVSHRVPEPHQATYLAWQFRANLVGMMIAPGLTAFTVTHSPGLSLLVAGLLNSVAALVFLRIRALGEHENFGGRVSFSWRRWATTMLAGPGREAAAGGEAGRSTSSRKGLRSVRYVKHVAILVTLIVTEALGNRANEAFEVYFVTDTLGIPAAAYGVLMAGAVAGLTLGSVLIEWTRRRIHARWWPSFCYSVFGASFLAKGLATGWATYMIFGFLQGLSAGLVAGIVGSAVMKFTPRALIGSVSVALGVLFQAASTAGLLLWAAWAFIGASFGPTFMATAGYRTAYIVGGACILVAALMSYRFFKHVRWQIER